MFSAYRPFQSLFLGGRNREALFGLTIFIQPSILADAAGILVIESTRCPGFEQILSSDRDGVGPMER